MTVEMIVTIATLGFIALSGLVGIIVAICRGEIKKFIVEMMEKAEEIYKDLPKAEKSVKKFQYVIMQVKDKYKFASVILNVKNFIDYIISISKQINHK